MIYEKKTPSFVIFFKPKFKLYSVLLSNKRDFSLSHKKRVRYQGGIYLKQHNHATERII